VAYLFLVRAKSRPSVASFVSLLKTPHHITLVCKAMSAKVARWAARGWGRVCSLSGRAAHEGDTEYSEAKGEAE
jgi:hypothetical protein